jgi:hypothetical protein
VGDLGLVRNPPRGWVPGQAFARQHRSYERGTGGSEGEHFATSRDLEVEWEVHVEGQDPYTFVDTRKAPVWVSRTRIGAGKRWYSVRAKRTYGLMPTVGIPCFVDPDDPHNLWIDWDAGYELHEPAWKDHTAAAPERRAAEKERIQREDAAAVARADAEPVSPEIAAAQEAKRLYDLNKTMAATVVSATDTGRALSRSVPIWRFELALADGREVTFEQAVAKRALDRYEAGAQITVYVDPDAPDAVVL